LCRAAGFESEERPALHTATRDFFGAQERTAIAKSAADEAFAETEKLKKLIEKIDSEKKFTDLIVVGIGGSELGPKAILLAMENLIKEKRQVHFVSSVDPDEMAETLKTLSLKNTLVFCKSLFKAALSIS
jgi:glucose-6-phosphate isomerase